MAKGIDLPIDAGRFVDDIKSAGIDFVARYYRSATSHFPSLSASEAKLLSSSGLKIVVVWEGASNHVSYFSQTAGANDGTSAYHQAKVIGQPADSAIYFAVDYDATAADVAGPIRDYFRGVAAGFAAAGGANPGYQIGVYGSGAVCRALIDAGLASLGWLAMATGWRDFNAFVDACDILQGEALDLPFDHDSDEADEDYGEFQV
ncbi:MAG TPA: DUF1906 domain-containing protein [Stellaceae bacterium]|nr:DUF1906 domain-containing protein [Stellaceae bacterium]